MPSRLASLASLAVSAARDSASRLKGTPLRCALARSLAPPPRGPPQSPAARPPPLAESLRTNLPSASGPCAALRAVPSLHSAWARFARLGGPRFRCRAAPSLAEHRAVPAMHDCRSPRGLPLPLYLARSARYRPLRASRIAPERGPVPHRLASLARSHRAARERSTTRRLQGSRGTSLRSTSQFRISRRSRHIGLRGSGQSAT